MKNPESELDQISHLSEAQLDGVRFKLTDRLLLIMATACGICVANIYYNQPLLALFQKTFPHSIGLVNLVPTLTQLGFACGLFLLIPLGDILSRRKLILYQTIVLALALILLVLSSGIWALLILSIVIGITGSVAQQIVPFAAELAVPERRGRTIGIVMSGVLCGILLGRALGGFIAEHWGWRSTFLVGAILTSVVWLILLLMLPQDSPKPKHSYISLMKSLIVLWRTEKQLRQATYIQALLFASFIGVWTVLALYLHEQFKLGADVAGLMGIVGAVGVLIAPIVGRLADHRGPYTVIGLGILIMAISFLVLGVWGTLIGLVFGIILLDLGEQTALIANQHIIYSLHPEARSRINTVFMTGMFMGGALGSYGLSLAWRLGGWSLVSIVGGLLPLAALLLHYWCKHKIKS